MIRRAALLLLALPLAIQGGRQPLFPPPEPEPLPARAWDHEGFSREIFMAVIEGLYADGVQNEVVDRIAEIDEVTNRPVNFVYACPVCMPALDAFRLYRGRPRFFGIKGEADTFGAGLPEELVRRLTSPDPTRRLPAVEELVLGWMRRRMDSLRLTEEERETWGREMEARRKQGMAYLEAYRHEGGSYAAMDACALCDAANGACRPR